MFIRNRPTTIPWWIAFPIQVPELLPMYVRIVFGLVAWELYLRIVHDDSSCTRRLSLDPDTCVSLHRHDRAGDHEGGKHHNPDWVDNVYVTSDYSEASTLIWDTIRGKEESALKFDSKGSLIPPSGLTRLVLELLPQTKKELAEMEGNVKSKTDLSYYLAVHKSLQPHSAEWIRQNGMCLENLLPFKSTLPHAGQGAFSQYHLKKGDIIMPAPLLQIMDKDVLDIYTNGQRIGEQLLLNYCFGHPQSSMLLCPDTQAELINHCSKRTKQCGRHGPNAAIRWSRGWDPTSGEYVELLGTFG
eukprot:scaffold2768_cov161-Amphora_coffeaeformis.AAC.2